MGGVWYNDHNDKWKWEKEMIAAVFLCNKVITESM
jgi:hypothetical protein